MAFEDCVQSVRDMTHPCRSGMRAWPLPDMNMLSEEMFVPGLRNTVLPDGIGLALGKALWRSNEFLACKGC